MRRPSRLLVPLAAALTLLPATGAHAARATFSAVFEATRAVKWDQPRTVRGGSCRGRHFYVANGGEEAEIKTKPFKVTVDGPGTAPFWKFGDGRAKDPREYGIQGHGPHKRWFVDSRGTTGDWCAGPEVHPPPERDCGTRLPTYLVAFDAHRGLLSWSASHAPWMANEKLNFYTCSLVVPEGMQDGSFPRLEARFSRRDIFNRRKRKIVVEASRSYGPDLTPVDDTGVNRTTSGTFSWKLTLTRTR